MHSLVQQKATIFAKVISVSTLAEGIERDEDVYFTKEGMVSIASQTDSMDMGSDTSSYGEVTYLLPLTL